MFKLIVNRLLVGLPTMLLVSFSVFVVIDISPTDPARRIAGETATQEQLEDVRDRLGLNEPVLERYGNWLGDAVQGDLGSSLTTRKAVTSMISEALPLTASLALFAMVLATVGGLIGGLLASMKRNGPLDRLITGLSALGVAVPPFWLGLMLVLLFSVKLGWLPAVGYAPLSEGLWPWASHLLLPAVALSTLFLAENTRQLRASMIDVLDQQYILAARARGITSRTITFKHALVNALGPVITISAFRVATLIGGTVIVERVFVLRGVGSMMAEAAFVADVPVVLGVTAMTLVAVLVAGVLADFAYGYVNPRARVR